MTAAQDSRALKPCPFCGANAHFAMDEGRWEWVECDGCGIQGNRSASLMEDCKPKLAEAWNRRAALSAEPVAYLVERHAFSVSPHGQDAEGNSWLEECQPTEPGAFPVYAAPQPAAQEPKPLTGAQIEALPVWHHFIGLFPDARLEITRAVERAHGITGEH